MYYLSKYYKPTYIFLIIQSLSLVLNETFDTRDNQPHNLVESIRLVSQDIVSGIHYGKFASRSRQIHAYDCLCEELFRPGRKLQLGLVLDLRDVVVLLE